jgi:hypothetical protein
MALNAAPFTAGSVLVFAYQAVVWVVMLFIKLCYSTALYGTLAEINRRILVFRQGKRPVLRAILLLPTVVLFVTTILFALSFFRIIFGAQKITDLKGLLNAADIIFLFLRVGFLLAGVVLGAVLGVMLGRNIPVGRDRFGGLLYRNKGWYLGFWLFTFTLCGFFRLMPWGFVTYWTIWFLVLAACIVTAAHWTLYGALRAVAATEPPGLPPGEPVDLTLAPGEAVALSALLRARGPMPFGALGQSLSDPDTAWLARLDGRMGSDAEGRGGPLGSAGRPRRQGAGRQGPRRLGRFGPSPAPPPARVRPGSRGTHRAPGRRRSHPRPPAPRHRNAPRRARARRAYPPRAAAGNRSRRGPRHRDFLAITFSPKLRAGGSFAPPALSVRLSLAL